MMMRMRAALWAQLTRCKRSKYYMILYLSSIFKQGSLTAIDEQAGILNVEFPKELTFFSDIIENTKTAMAAAV